MFNSSSMIIIKLHTCPYQFEDRCPISVEGKCWSLHLIFSCLLMLRYMCPCVMSLYTAPTWDAAFFSLLYRRWMWHMWCSCLLKSKIRKKLPFFISRWSALEVWHTVQWRPSHLTRFFAPRYVSTSCIWNVFLSTSYDPFTVSETGTSNQGLWCSYRVLISLNSPSTSGHYSPM